MVIRIHNDTGDKTTIRVAQVPVVLSTKQFLRLKKELNHNLSGLTAIAPDGRPALIMPGVATPGGVAAPTLLLPGPFYACEYCGVQGQDTLGRGQRRKWCSDACRMKMFRRREWERILPGPFYTCEYCGAQKKYKKRNCLRRKWCSFDCMVKAKQRKMQDENVN